MCEIFAQILWSTRNLILAFLCSFSLWVSGAIWEVCHKSFEYEKSDLKLLEFLPLWGFAV